MPCPYILHIAVADEVGTHYNHIICVCMYVYIYIYIYIYIYVHNYCNLHCIYNYYLTNQSTMSQCIIQSLSV